MMTRSAMTLLFGTAANAQVPNLGASGATAAMAGRYFILYPGSRILTVVPFVPIPVPAWIYLGHRAPGAIARTEVRRPLRKDIAMGKTKDIREAVESELIDDPLVDAACITVMNINGEVALNGTVPSYPQYLKAAEAAWRIAGVTNVHNHLEVVLPPENYRDDAMLTTAANNALAASATVPEGVEATAEKGNLRLTGMVKYRSQCAAAESAVTGLIGVRNIKDEIELAFDVDPADINRLVRKALDRHSVPPDDGHVWVNTTGNTVTLIGQVRTQAQRDAVVDAVWRGHGVMVVLDELEITG
ncbi:MAG TPA: BON domain-containing protein [Streptosporangiaceae bacterium]|nr:BON domain-containing protein [Streptosporangiaceae bacterium]